MISLSPSAIYYAVMKCVKTSDYHIIIAVPYSAKMQGIFDDCMEIIERFDFDRPSCKMSHNKFSVFFDNNSSIRCILANDNARGYAAHLVIYDELIFDDTKRNILQACEKMKE